MRVFVTGATGFIGARVVAELIAAGHEVLGLARSKDSADTLAATGADVHSGALANLDSLRGGAAASDAVIHLGFRADFAKFEASSRVDRRAIEALVAVVAGSSKPLIVPNGMAGLTPPDRMATEAPHRSWPDRRSRADRLHHSISAVIMQPSALCEPRRDHGRWRGDTFLEAGEGIRPVFPTLNFNFFVVYCACTHSLSALPSHALRFWLLGERSNDCGMTESVIALCASRANGRSFGTADQHGKDAEQMISRTRIPFTTIAATFLAATCSSAQAADTALPTFGHYIGYVTVAAPSSACTNVAGDHFMLQLELNTVKELPVFLTRTVAYDPTTGAPIIYKTAFDRTSGTKLAPSGTITLTDENDGLFVKGTYTAVYTPFDPNSFAGTVTLTYPTTTGACTETHETVFVRSSAD